MKDEDIRGMADFRVRDFQTNVRELCGRCHDTLAEFLLEEVTVHSIGKETISSKKTVVCKQCGVAALKENHRKETV